MVDPETIGALATAAGGATIAAKNLMDAVATGIGLVKGNKKAEGKLAETLEIASDLRSRLFDLQERALNLQQEYARLLSENRQLREDMSSKEMWSAERQKYKRKQVGKSVVIVHCDDSSLLFCPVCLESKHQAIPLQDQSGAFSVFGSYECPACRALYQ